VWTKQWAKDIIGTARGFKRIASDHLLPQFGYYGYQLGHLRRLKADLRDLLAEPVYLVGLLLNLIRESLEFESADFDALSIGKQQEYYDCYQVAIVGSTRQAAVLRSDGMISLSHGGYLTYRVTACSQAKKNKARRYDNYQQGYSPAKALKRGYTG
jgi:hypothetical protein